MWTPILTSSTSLSDSPDTSALPFGLIFACFMICIMIGSSFFNILRKQGLRVDTILGYILLISLLSLSAPLWTNNFQILTIAFLAFEVCCGVYFPSIGTLR